jgi:8-oxo-dGTP pyrophosphatase MutT (NUDIX family)
MNDAAHTLVATGSWNEDTTWELYLTSVMPPIELCSAVMCVAVANDKIVLTRSQRGWGMLGGHIEADETPEEALRREALEEGGFTIDSYQLFAVRKIISRRPMPHQQKGKTYPYPVGYLPYYCATTTQKLQPPTGEEIIESSNFALHEIVALNSHDLLTIEEGWKAFSKVRGPRDI